MTRLLFSFLFINFISIIYAEYYSPIVQTSLGGVKGMYKTSFGNRPYAAYEGIPYALPPTQEKRFQPPVPVQEWIGNISAIKESSVCIQYSMTVVDGKYQVEGDEDCLYLNIYVPVHYGTTPLPVLFVIHGGGLQFDSAPTGSKYFMDKDVIVVTINYRLGIMGFLSTEDDNVFGNIGLKDQSTALRWVSENIEHFGGDPKRITLFGLSAGGASVHYHYLSPWSKGLFQNGISVSGATFGPGKHTENSREKASQSRRKKILSNNFFQKWFYNSFTPFGPVVEKAGDKPCVNRTAIEIISSGDAADVLWLTSVVSEEGLYPAAEFINDEELLEELDNNWESIAPHLLDYNFTIPLDKSAEVARKIKNHYLVTNSISKKTVKQLIKLIGDRLYVVDGEKAAKLQAKMNKSPVLFWYYSYRALNSLSDVYSNTMNNWGVSHGDNFMLLFKNYFMYPPMKANDRAMQMKLLDLIVSVSEKGYPDFGLNFEWKKVDPSKEELDVLHIAHPNDIKMETISNIGEKQFWSTIDFDENKLIV